MAAKVIETFIKMQLYKKGGAMANNKAVKFASDALEKRLKDLGIDPNTLNNQTELNQILAYVKQAEDQAFNQLYSTVLSGDDAMNFLNKAFPKKGEIIKFPQKRTFAEEIESMKKSGDIVDADNIKISEKITDREMFKDASKRFNQTDIVADSVARITSMEPVAAMKEANKIIKREGIYKNLNKDQSQAILKSTDDWINQRDPADRFDYTKNRPFRDDPDFDPDDPDYIQRMKDEDAPDYATGGRAGHYTGGMVDVEPNLSDIGHGSDSLMARTRLVSPNNQATTSTGLNYLLAEDNDNIRVPFNEGKTYKQKLEEEIKKRLKYKKQGMEFDKPLGPEGTFNTGNQPKVYELAEGGRIGFSDAGDVYKRYQEYVTNMDKDLLKHFKYYKSLGGKMNMREYAPGFKREYADGGRIGFSGGGMSRRAFLKLMAALTGGVAMAKSGILSLSKKSGAKKLLPGITTPNAPGKPEWFDALVTRVIQEGDDVTKNFATKEREVVFKKKIDNETEVLVTQDLDNKITRVDIDDAKRNVAGGDDPPTVSLQVTDEIIEEGGSRSKPVFEATENDYRNYATDPDGGYETEFVENTVQNTKDLTSDLTKVKSFATNKKETMKEFIQSKKRKDNVKYANENTASYAADRGPDYDPTDFIDDMADDMATGGRAGFNLGGSAKKFLEKVFGKAGLKTIKSDDPDLYAGLSEVVDMYRNRDMEGLKKYLQKYLTHMDDEAIEDFIIGGTEATEGLSGELVRLGSGRDYKGKMEIFKKFDAMDDLENLDVTDEMIRKPNASGGIATMLGE